MTVITVCSYQFDQSDFHTKLKPRILGYLRDHGVDYRKIGQNPDITCKKGMVILTGQTKKGGQVKTDILFTDILDDLGLL